MGLCLPFSECLAVLFSLGRDELRKRRKARCGGSHEPWSKITRLASLGLSVQAAAKPEDAELPFLTHLHGEFLLLITQKGAPCSILSHECAKNSYKESVTGAEGTVCSSQEDASL